MAEARQLELVFHTDGQVLTETTLDPFTSRRLARVAAEMGVDVDEAAGFLVDAALTART